MKTVKEVSRITCVSVRTLHHYDAIGLLKPSHLTNAGYRLYDDAALTRLQTILLLRELEFPLKEIKALLEKPDFDPIAALPDQIRLLELKKDRLEGIIAHAKQLQHSGGMTMNFKPYDTTRLDDYAAEAKARWGKTETWKEYEQKTNDKSPQELNAAGDALMDIFAELGAVRHLSTDSAEAQTLVKKLQDHITANFYTCTNQILRGLGQMYVAGGEMTDNIDRAGGAGTAAFASKAIEHHCK